MKPLNATSLSVGILVTGWTSLTFGVLEPKVTTWITFLTWASYYAAGGGIGGLAKSIVSGAVGALLSAIVIWSTTQLGSSLLVTALLLGTLGWMLCRISQASLLACIPASFIGAAAFFGAGAPLDIKLAWVLTSIICGALMGLFSQRLAAVLTSKG